MNRYVVTFLDGTKVEYSGRDSFEARNKGTRAENKTWIRCDLVDDSG